MPASVTCGGCGAVSKAPDKASGRTLPCPRCREPIAVPTAAPAGDDFEVVEDAAPPSVVRARPVRPADEYTPAPARRKRKKKPAPHAGFFARAGEFLGNLDDGVKKLAVGSVAALVAAFVAFTVVRSVVGPPRPNPIAESVWQPAEVAGRLRATLPGHASRTIAPVPGSGMTMVTHGVQPDRDCVFSVASSEAELPTERRALPAEQLLNDSRDGAVANLSGMGAVGVGRESVQLGPAPGKQVVRKIPRADGKMIVRCYLAGGRLYIVLCGGLGFGTGQASVERFLNSLGTLEAPAPPAPKSPPPGQEP